MRFLGLTISDWTAVTNVLLTVGLLFFAGMQWWVTREAERTRARERSADEDTAQRNDEREQDRAFQTVWAEHFRLDALAEQWAAQDLVQLSALRVLRAADVLPRDWSVVMAALSRLSTEAGYLGALALTLAHDAERDVAILNGIIEGMARQYPNKGPEEIAQMVRQNRGRDVAQAENNVKERTRDLALLMWDAARHSPRADVDRTMDFRDDMRSPFGRHMVEQIKARETPENRRISDALEQAKHKKLEDGG